MVTANEFSAQQFEKLINQSDLDHDPVTLILKPNLDMDKMSHHAKNEISIPRHSIGTAQTDTQRR